MMNPISIINKYYTEGTNQYHILVEHSRDVAALALRIVEIHPELQADRLFVEEAAMLHDIGIFLTDAESIACFGKEPYILHGYMGANILRKEGYPRHAQPSHDTRHLPLGPGPPGPGPAHALGLPPPG